MLALPLSLVGALGALLAAGMTLNLFSLIGSSCFSVWSPRIRSCWSISPTSCDAKGMGKVEAMRHAAPVRMRPGPDDGALDDLRSIASGARGGAWRSETRQPMAVATAAGMFSSTLLTLIVVVPVFYLDDR